MSNDFFSAVATEFILPLGRREEREIVIPMSFKPTYEEMLRQGRQFEYERLRNGVVSATITSAEDGDHCVTLIHPGALHCEIESAFRTMLMHGEWRKKKAVEIRFSRLRKSDGKARELLEQIPHPDDLAEALEVYEQDGLTALRSFIKRELYIQIPRRQKE